MAKIIEIDTDDGNIWLRVQIWLIVQQHQNERRYGLLVT
ncbi:hypothetical protein BH18THE2_BH18THE2_08950 [soil metagenome]